MENITSATRRRTDDHVLEFLKDLEKDDPDYLQSLADETFKFFWSSSEVTNKEEDGNLGNFKNIWTPYKDDDNLYLEHCFRKFTKGESSEHPEIGDYKINFVKWYRYHKIDDVRQTIVRADTNNIDNVYRLSRVIYNDFENKKQKIPIEDIESIKHTNIGKYKITVHNPIISKEISNKYTYMEFNVIPGQETKFLILNIFKEKIDFNLEKMNLKELKFYLIKELDFNADSISEFNTYKLKYLNELEENNFYEKILKMYSSEGFLYIY